MKRGHVLALCDGGMVSAALGAGLLPVFLTTFSEEFGGLSEAKLGQLPALLFGGVVAGILFSGPLADRLGVRLFAVIGLALSAAGLLGAACTGSFGMLLLAAGVIGLGAGVLDMLMSPIVAALYPERRASALNHLHAFWSIGVVATVGVSAGAIALGIPWRALVGGLAVLPLALLAGFLFAPLPPLVHPDHERHGLRRLLRNPRFYLALLMILLVGMSEEGMSQWLPAYAERELGYSKASAGLALAVYAMAQSAGRLAGASPLVARVPPHALLLGASLASGCCYLMAAWAPLPWIGLAAGVGAGLACSVLWPTNLAIASDGIPHGGATLFAALAGAGNFGCLLAPWTEGLIAAQSNLHVALAAGAVPPLLLASLAALVVRKKRAHNKVSLA